MLIGSHALSIDAKGRFAVPARFREGVTESCGGKLIATLNIDVATPSLRVYPLPEFQRITETLRTLPEVDTDAQTINYLILGHAAECDMDTQGRMLLPQNLRDHANLKKQITIVGQSTKFDIWDTAAWAERSNDMLKQALKLRNNPSEAVRALVL